MWSRWTKLGWGVMTAGVLLLVLFSIRYFTLDPAVYFPRQREVYEAETLALIIHIAAMTVAALVGPFQFLRALRTRRPRLHRSLGRLYVAGTTIGALSGLYLAQFAASGRIAGLGFALLALGVLLTTGRALWAILHRQVPLHREWMMRSFALILAAVTLRIETPLLQVAFGEVTGYAIVAWMCWVPNLLVAEWLIRRRRQPSPASARLARADAIGVGR